VYLGLFPIQISLLVRLLFTVPTRNFDWDPLSIVPISSYFCCAQYLMASSHPLDPNRSDSLDRHQQHLIQRISNLVHLLLFQDLDPQPTVRNLRLPTSLKSSFCCFYHPFQCEKAH
jgi:hypothetical protein